MVQVSNQVEPNYQHYRFHYEINPYVPPIEYIGISQLEFTAIETRNPNTRTNTFICYSI